MKRHPSVIGDNANFFGNIISEKEFIPFQNVHLLIRDLSVSELSRNLERRGISVPYGSFKGDLQKELLTHVIKGVNPQTGIENPNIFQERKRRKTGEVTHFPLYEEIKKSKIVEHKRKKPSKVREEESTPENNNGSDPEDYYGPLVFVDPAPVGKENKKSCFWLQEGLVIKNDEQRLIGGKGNKTPLPPQVVKVKVTHPLLRSYDPRDFEVVVILLSHNKINTKLKVLMELDKKKLEKGQDGRWGASFDELVVKHSSHSNGPYLKLRFQLKNGEDVIHEFDSYSFKTITKKGIKKRERRREGIGEYY